MQHYFQFNKLVRILLASLLIISFQVHASDNDSAAQAVATVAQFNAAITARDVDAIMATLAEGSVQFQLRAVHPGMSDNPPLTANLQATWKAVAAILFPMSDAYERKAEIIRADAIGEVATVWANTTTHTLRKGKEEPMNLAFSEVYLLVQKPDGWKIAGIADNRKPDNITVNQE